jgi:hypothetical protein
MFLPRSVGGRVWAWQAILVTIGAGILLVPAMANGFPFVYDDTADYIVFTPRLYRSPYYGLFIFFFHLNTFIWLPVVAQALILSHIIWTWVRIEIDAKRQMLVFAAAIVLLTLFSSAPIMAAYLMADTFTAVMVLAIGLLVFRSDRLSTAERIYFFLLASLAAAAHVSHVSIAAALCAVLFLLQLAQGESLRQAGARLRLVAAAILLAMAANVLNSAVIHRMFTLSPAGSSFLLANLIEYGPARRYLNEACPEAGYKICAQLEQIPDNSFLMLWGTEFYNQLGGIPGMREEASRIVLATLKSRPGDVLDMVVQVVGKALLRRAPGAELAPIGNTYWFEDTLNKRFGPATLRSYRSSAQARNVVPRDMLSRVDAVIFPTSLAIVIGGMIFAAWYRRPEPVALGALVLGGFAVNTVLCAVASGVFDRYQSRVSWLLPFAAVLLVGRLVDARARCVGTLPQAADQARA